MDETKSQTADQAAIQSTSFFPAPDTTFLQVCRLARDDQRGSVFVGHSANESFLQQIRQLVARTLGSCPFVDQPIQYLTHHDTSTSLSTSLGEVLKPPPKPSPARARFLWLGQQGENKSLSTALCYLILANGALACSEDEDAIASAYFSYARYLTNLELTEEPSLESILCHSLIAFYHLNIGRRDAAYQSAGLACRGACSMGIHRVNLPSLMSHESYAFRDRLWKALRRLDIFTSGSLGRPVCTTETRNTKIELGYSSVIDITAILDDVLREAHRPTKPTRNFIAKMTQEHRLWAARMPRGLQADGFESTELGEGCECVPSLTLSNIKESYYWSIMLLTRPVLLERASTQTTRVGLDQGHYGNQGEVPPISNSDTALVYASVDSAVRTIRLLQCLLSREDLPKRLPFPVNSAFTAALTLAVATFADLDRVFPLRANLETVEKILQRFEKNDSIARYYRHIVEQLQLTCDEYIEKRNNRIMEKQNHMVDDLFGRLHEEPLLSKETFDSMDVRWIDKPAINQEPLSESPTGSSSTICLTDESLMGADSIDGRR
ncbi:hypothetical protein HG530_004016 [Fusarium avenaceum]|nr:hypothetical protein HG530_004016 [Fusarium avenaceum]